MASSVGDDDLPIAVRRKRRSSMGLSVLKPSQINTASSQVEGSMETPPLTPVRKKKRVRFSAPGPSLLADELPTGLTPAVQRAAAQSKNKVPNRRHSAPSTSWNLDFSSSQSPVSGIQQFLPLCQVLEGRVKRRLRRRGLSEEINNIESARKTREKSRLAELKRLKAELENKDREMQDMRDEWDLRSQFGTEVGNSQDPELSDKVRELEAQISELQNELKHREVEPSLTNDEPDWGFAARDPFHDYGGDDDDEPMPRYDNDFDETTNMNDIISSTPTRRSFPSPPSTQPNTPPHNLVSSQTTVSIQADFVDPEKERLEEQLAILQADLTKISATMEQTNEHHSRLSSKLSSFIPSENLDPSNLDNALDTLLTRLALSQSSLTETNTLLNTLQTSILDLGFSPTSSPPEIIALIASQFRQARLDLEYLNPGELTTGFENGSLLNLLVERVRTLLGQVQSRDSSIEQYQSEAESLRSQLAAHVSGLEALRKDLADAKAEIGGLNTELSWQTSSNEKLKKALEGYREEVKGLEDLVNRMETDHGDAEAQLKSDLENAVRRADGLDAEIESYKSEQATSRAVLEGREILLKELKTRLDSALATISTLQEEMTRLASAKDAEMAQLVAAKDSEIEALRMLMSAREDEKEEDYMADVASRSQRVEALESDLQDLQHSLASAHSLITILQKEKEGLQTRLRDERGRANGVVMVMREQLKNALNVGLGFLEESDNEDQQDTSGAHINHQNEGKFLNGEFARRRSSGGAPVLPMKEKKKGRRKYDSGLGFLDEEDEEDMGGGHTLRFGGEEEGEEVLEM